MRKDRYITNDDIADIDRLTDLSWSIDLKNTVSIRWSWPRNGGIKLAVVFTAESEDDTLDTLLERETPVIITKDLDKIYTKPLDAQWRIYRVFPAYFGEGSDVAILNQTTENTTGKVSKVVTVDYKIEYKPLPLSDYQRVNLSIKCSDELPNEHALAYSKQRGDVQICNYPAAGCDGGYSCYIKKNETITLYVTDEYTGSVFLRKS